MNPISQIKLEREDKRIKLTLPYNPTYIKKIKTIPGYYWHPYKKYWSFPYSEDIFKKILSLFDGENIHLDSTLQRLTEGTERIYLKYFGYNTKIEGYPNKFGYKRVAKRLFG